MVQAAPTAKLGFISHSRNLKTHCLSLDNQGNAIKSPKLSGTLRLTLVRNREVQNWKKAHVGVLCAEKCGWRESFQPPSSVQKLSKA